MIEFQRGMERTHFVQNFADTFQLYMLYKSLIQKYQQLFQEDKKHMKLGLLGTEQNR